MFLEGVAEAASVWGLGIQAWQTVRDFDVELELTPPVVRLGLSVMRGVSGRLWLRVRDVSGTHRDEATKLPNDSENVLCDIRTTGPVADVLRECFLLASWRRRALKGHSRHDSPPCQTFCKYRDREDHPHLDEHWAESLVELLRLLACSPDVDSVPIPVLFLVRSDSTLTTPRLSRAHVDESRTNTTAAGSTERALSFVLDVLGGEPQTLHLPEPADHCVPTGER